MTMASSAVFSVAIGAVVALPVVFRRHRWIRVAAVVVMLGAAGLAWTGVVTSPRIAIEKAGYTSWQPEDRFFQGAFAARDVGMQMKLPFWAAVLGLATLALLPSRAQR